MPKVDPLQLRAEAVRRLIEHSFSTRVVNRGLNYAATGRVIEIDYDIDESCIVGQVLGSNGEVYLTQLRLAQGGILLSMDCTCPMRWACKHSCALLWIAVATLARGSSLPEIAKYTLPGEGVLPEAFNKLHTFNNGHDLPKEIVEETQPLSPITRAGFKHLVNVLTGQDDFVESVAAKTYEYVYVFEETYHHKLQVTLFKAQKKKNGEYGQSYLSDPYMIINPDFDEIAEVNCHEIDREIVKKWLLAAEKVKTMSYGELLNDRDVLYPFLESACSSGRARWQTVKGPILSVGQDLAAHLAFRRTSDGTYTLYPRSKDDIEGIITFVGTPGLYLNTRTKQIGCLTYTNKISAKLGDAIRALPAVRRADLTAISIMLETWGAPLDIKRPDDAKQTIVRLVHSTPSVVMKRHKYPHVVRKLNPKLPETIDLAILYFKPPHGFNAGEFSRTFEDEKLDAIILEKLDKKYELDRLKEFTALGFKQIMDPEAIGLDAGPVYLSAAEMTWANFAGRDRERLTDDGWNITLADSFRLNIVEETRLGKWAVTFLPRGVDFWFGMELGIDINGVNIPLLPILMTSLIDMPDNDVLTPSNVDFLNIGGKFYCRMENGEVLALPFDRVRDVLILLTEIGDYKRSQKIDVPIAQAAKLLSKNFMDKVRGEGAAELKRIAKSLSGGDSATAIEPHPDFKGELRNYQKDGLGWLQFLREFNLGGILADEMGLGKTVQALAHMHLEKKSGRMESPFLVVAPKSVLPNWYAECLRFAPDLRVLYLNGERRKGLFNDLHDADIVLTSYPLLLRDRSVLSEITWHGIILDEAQNIKNPRSKIKQSATILKGKHRISMTGTPVENNLSEIWSQFDFLLPGMLGNVTSFNKEYRQPIERFNNEKKREKLTRCLKPFILRRTKETVTLELPPKTVVVQPVELVGAQRDFYESLRTTMLEQIRSRISEEGFGSCQMAIVDAMLKLRQACCDPRLVKLEAARSVNESAKLDLLFDLLIPLLEEKRRIIVFSQFTKMMDIIEGELDARGIEYLDLRGSTEDRVTPVKRFQNGECPLFVISLKAGGTGLNLTAADTVIIYDPWWNPAVEDQAMDRAHRIGQAKPVFVYKLVAANTIEERIQELQTKKKKLYQAILDPARQDSLKFEMKDLDLLFGPLKMEEELEEDPKDGKFKKVKKPETWFNPEDIPPETP